MDFGTMIQLGVPLLAIGGAWGGAKAAINGTKDRVRKLEADNDNHNDRLARMETKIDILLEKR